VPQPLWEARPRADSGAADVSGVDAFARRPSRRRRRSHTPVPRFTAAPE